MNATMDLTILETMTHDSTTSGGTTAVDADLFAALPDIDDATTRRLHDRLERAADTDGLLDVAYRTLDTPIGTLLVAATPMGLVRIAFEVEDHDAILERLAEQVSPRVLRAPARLDGAARELDAYFEGRRIDFDLPLDLRLARGFRRDVLERLRGVGYGCTATYADLAVLAGRPRAVRAVGTACATNPLPIVVPCHRVVRSDGGLGGYLGGVEVKRGLLAMEAGEGRSDQASVL